MNENLAVLEQEFAWSFFVFIFSFLFSKTLTELKQQGELLAAATRKDFETSEEAQKK